MTRMNTKLTAAVETYLTDLRRVSSSGGATGERSNYGPLANLLNAVGAALKPKVFCVGELADQGAGHPDFGLYAAKKVQKGRPREGQLPECGVVEVKPVDDHVWLTAEGDQVSRYWNRYRLVLVTNMRDFVLVGEDVGSRPAKLETFCFEDERGARFFHSTLVQTLFYGIFSAWVLWARSKPAPAGRFDWRTAVWHLRASVLRALFHQLSGPGWLRRLDLVEVMDWTAAALDRVDRAVFFTRFNEGEAVPYFYEPFLEAFDPDLRKQLGGLVHAG